MNSEAVTAPPEYIEQFVRWVETLSPRHRGIVNTDLAHHYYSIKNIDVIEAARRYVAHRPRYPL